MKNYRFLAVALLVLQVMPLFGKTGFTPTVKQVELGKKNNYICYSENNEVDSIKLGNLTDLERFKQTFSGTNISVSSSNMTTNTELYYSTFYTEVTIPAHKKQIIEYTFNLSQYKELSGLLKLGNAGHIYEIFNYGDNISESEAKNIHKNITFNSANNSNASCKYSVLRNYNVTSGSASMSSSKTISYTYDNSKNNSNLVVRQYWGYAVCIRWGSYYSHRVYSSLNITAQYEDQIAFDENGFDQNGGYQKPDLENGYYIINNAGNLYWFADYVNAGNTAAKAKLAKDICDNNNVLVEGKLNSNYKKFRKWTPIANGSSFSGEIEGQGYSISGIYCSKTSNNNIGLISKTSGNAKVSNLTISDSYFFGKNYVGSFVGYATGLSLTNCINTSSTRGTSQIGGLVGYANANGSNVTAKNCNNTGSITATGTYVGGIFGYAYNCKIYNCCNTYKFGIAKTLTYSTLSNCYWFNSGYNIPSNPNQNISATNCSSFDVNGTKATLTTSINGSTDLLTVLNSYATSNNLKAWSNFIYESSNKMFILDYYAIKLSQHKWSTLCLPFNSFISMGEGKAYYAIANEDCDNIEKIEETLIPKETGILVHGNADEVITFKYTTEEVDANDENDVLGTTKAGGEIFGPEDGCKFYIMSVNSNGVFGFYWDKSVQNDPELNEGKAAKCNQYKAVLRVNNAFAAKSFFSLDDNDEETAIEENVIASENNNDRAYNLAGQAVDKNSKGIVIVNGKKYLNK